MTQVVLHHNDHRLLQTSLLEQESDQGLFLRNSGMNIYVMR